MLIEILICAGIALGIMIGWYLLYLLYNWLDENTCIDMEAVIAILLIFAMVFVGVFGTRRIIKKYQEENPVKTEILLENGEPINAQKLHRIDTNGT